VELSGVIDPPPFLVMLGSGMLAKIVFSQHGATDDELRRFSAEFT
jgi:hypothetical protein